MKRIIAIVTLMIAVLLCSCGNEKEKTSEPKYSKGDIITLGKGQHFMEVKYDEDGAIEDFLHEEEETPIEWIVLDVDDKGQALLISKYVITVWSLNENEDDYTWESCELRAKLQEVKKGIFTEDEQKAILKSELKNPDNSTTGVKGCSDTEDYLFLLSIDEANKYFSRGLTGEKEGKLKSGNNYYWWLRSPGMDTRCAAMVGQFGTNNYDAVNAYGNMSNNWFGIRFAMKVDLNKLP